MPSLRSLISRLVLLCLLSVAGPVAAWADEAPPSRVGRVSAVVGTVSLRPSGGEWTDSLINDPVASGMSVRTAGPAHAALAVGGEAIHLAGGTEIGLARLDDGTVQIAIRQGRIGVHLGRLDAGETFEIDLPRGGIWLLGTGDYDIVAGDDQMPARVAVIEGLARFIGGGADETAATGSALVLSGKDPVSAALGHAEGDDFVASWQPTPGDTVEPAALRFVSPEMTGYEMLDANGSWEAVEGLGEVWYPKTASDEWAPYRYGRWQWIAPWGWTWIDDAPWGFAPSHYGRWARVEGRWAWAPGKLVAHPAYAPALVDFLGTAGVGLSIPDAAGAAVAWFPLAPGEIYWPSYTGELDAIRRLNAASVADPSTIEPAVNGDVPAAIVNADYQNRRFATIVPRAVFVSGRAVAPALLQLPERRLADAPLLPGSPQIGPPVPRPAIIAAARPALANAVHALARILSARTVASVPRTAVLRGARSGRSGAIKLPLASRSASRSTVTAGHVARLRVVSASARTSHPSARFAAAGHTRTH